MPSSTPTPLPVGVIPPTPTPPTIILGPVADLVATGIEVTQGTQNLANQMPLVEGRWTAVRVYLKTQDPAVGIANVKGGLGAWRNGQPLGVIFADNAPIIGRPDGGLRTNVQDSLLFWLPPDWRSGEVHLKAMVYAGLPSSVDKEPDSVNNFIEVDVEFHPADPALIRLVPVHLHDDWDPAKADITYTYQDHVADSLEVLLDAFRLLPIYEMYFDPSLEYLISFLGQDVVAKGPVLPVGHSQGVEWRLDESGQAQLPNAGITALKLLSSDYYQNWQWYGTVDPNVAMKLFKDGSSINISGISNGTTAYGRIEKTNLDQPPWWVRGGMTLAHEMAHNIMPGADHILCKGGEEAGGSLDPNYPYPYDDNPPKTCSMAGIDPEGYYGFDVYWSLWPYLTGPTVIGNDPAAPAPNAGFPLMGYKRPHWVDPYDYCKLLNGLGVPCDETAINVSSAPGLDMLQASTRGLSSAQGARAARPALTEARRQSNAEPYIYVSVVTDDSTGTATIVETMPLSSPPQLALDEAAQRLRAITLGSLTGRFVLTFEDPSGNVFNSYRLVDLDPPNHDGASASHLFTELLPMPRGTAFIRVRSGASIVAERRVSPGTPTVRVLDPNGGGGLAGPVEVTWEASDPDGDTLTFSVLYSPDGGTIWNPIAVGLDSKTLRLQSPAGLAGGDAGKFRVIASDGANMAQDDSDGVFSVPQNAPSAYILGPADGATFQRGATVTLFGGAFDLEDRIVDPRSFHWRSSLDGDLGDGREVQTRSLTTGNHRITLTATDSSGAAGEVGIDITIATSNLAGVPNAAEQRGIAQRLGQVRGDSDDRRLLFLAGGLAVVAVLVILALVWRRRTA